MRRYLFGLRVFSALTLLMRPQVSRLFAAAFGLQLRQRYAAKSSQSASGMLRFCRISLPRFGSKLARICVLILMASLVTSCQELIVTSNYFSDSVIRASNEAQLIQITSDASPGEQFDFKGITNSNGDLTGLLLRRTNGDPIFYNLSELPKGLALMKANGIEVVTVYSKDFDARTGGTAYARYLHQLGIPTSEYRDFHFEIHRERGQWIVYKDDASGRLPFKKMFLKKNEMPIIGVIGILEITTS
jgi:hypothetical protein